MTFPYQYLADTGQETLNIFWLTLLKCDMHIHNHPQVFMKEATQVLNHAKCLRNSSSSLLDEVEEYTKPEYKITHVESTYLH